MVRFCFKHRLHGADVLKTIVVNAPTIHDLWHHGWHHIRKRTLNRNACGANGNKCTLKVTRAASVEPNDDHPEPQRGSKGRLSIVVSCILLAWHSDGLYPITDTQPWKLTDISGKRLEIEQCRSSLEMVFILTSKSSNTSKQAQWMRMRLRLKSRPTSIFSWVKEWAKYLWRKSNRTHFPPVQQPKRNTITIDSNSAKKLGNNDVMNAKAGVEMLLDTLVISIVIPTSRCWSRGQIMSYRDSEYLITGFYGGCLVGAFEGKDGTTLFVCMVLFKYWYSFLRSPEWIIFPSVPPFT